MPVIQRSESVAAGATVQNTIAGSAYEFARSRQVVSIGVTQSATGMFVAIQSGSDIVSEEFEPFILTTPPIIPDHMYYNDVMEIGDRLVIRVRNPTGGALTIRTLVQISQI
jgi:hypothetical protein